MAYTEMYLKLANVMRRFDFEPYDTSADHVRLFWNFSFGAPWDGPVGVRAVVADVKSGEYTVKLGHPCSWEEATIW